MTPPFVRLFLAAVAATATGAPQYAAQTPPAPSTAPRPASGQIPLAPLRADEAARVDDTSLSFAELDQLFIARRAKGPQGREALKHLLDTRLLDALARESRLSISPAELDRRTQEIEARVIAAGEAKNMAEYLERTGVDPVVFREYLRLALIQETLARRALGTPDDQELNGEKQEMWLAQVAEQRGAQFPSPPWADGVAARCGDLEVKVSEFLERLRYLLPSDDVREDCFQLLLQKRVRARLPDLAPEALEKAIDHELARRRQEIENDPRYRGLSYEQVMGAQGMATAYLRQDPAVVIAALATLWVDRSRGDAGLREVYAKEREHFDGRYGEAIEARLLFLRALELPNALVPRDFAGAERELSKLRDSIHGVDDFGRFARERSEERASGEKDGRVGFVTRLDERLPAEVREALFRAKPAADGSALLGPLRTTGGVCLLWAGVRRPAPGWEEMSTHVHRELRKRFLDEVLVRERVRTYLDKK